MNRKRAKARRLAWERRLLDEAGMRMRSLSIWVVLGVAGCTGAHQPPPPPDEGPFEPDPPAVYVAKVKNLLVGLPPSDDEIRQVAADPTQLQTLIQHWMLLPEYRAKMMRFFELAFQQTQITLASFTDISSVGLGTFRNVKRDLLLQNIQESFARTVLELIDEHRPFTEAITTRRYMMTVPLMEWYGLSDTVYFDDNGRMIDTFPGQTANKTLYIGSQAIPLADSLNPASASYMHFADPQVATFTLPDPSCDPFAYPPPPMAQIHAPHALHSWFNGQLSSDGFFSSTGFHCIGKNAASLGGATPNAAFTNDDYSQWKMVTIAQPGPGEQPSPWWNVPFLRSAYQLVLKIPRQGFFSTPAFQANWSTNTSNQMRVTANQTLIVALGQAFDGSDPTTPPTAPGVDTDHTGTGNACFGCHQLLDPMRETLAASYSWGYGQQTDPAFVGQPGQLAVQGSITPLHSVDDLANALAGSPLFAQAWAQKLCYYANSAPCDADDPEFQRIVADFAAHYDWNTLVQEMFASPLTTNATPTTSRRNDGVVVAVARLDHLCSALANRLGIADPCVLDPLHQSLLTRPSTVELVAGGLPSDGYGRGSTTPVLPNAPTLFYRAAVEQICKGMATQVVDGATPKWSSTSPDPAIADFVSIMMALEPSDPRYDRARALLRSHFDAATAQQFSATDSLRSTFVVACLSPSFIGIGM